MEGVRRAALSCFSTDPVEKQDLKAAALIPAEAAVKSYAAPFIDWSLESNCITLIRLVQLSSTI